MGTLNCPPTPSCKLAHSTTTNTRVISLDVDVCTYTVFNSPSSYPTHVFCALPATLVLCPKAGLSSTVMSTPNPFFPFALSRSTKNSSSLRSHKRYTADYFPSPRCKSISSAFRPSHSGSITFQSYRGRRTGNQKVQVGLRNVEPPIGRKKL